MSKAKSMLDMIKHRQRFDWMYKPVDYEEPDEPEIATQRMSADDWQAFKARFVLEYGGEKVEITGMTGNEFLKYIKTSGYRENDEFNSIRNLKKFLKKMDQDDLA